MKRERHKNFAGLQNASAKASHHIAPVSIIHLLQRCVLGSPGSRETWGRRKRHDSTGNYKKKKKISPPKRAGKTPDKDSSLLN